MILFDNWTIANTDAVIARQHDNLSRSLVVTGDLPEGWGWIMQVRCHGHYDPIPLKPMDGGVGVVLTESQLAFGGWYAMQLKGVQADITKHSNVIQVYIPESLSGDGDWPTIPSEFTQLEARMREIAAHPPIPGDNGYWQLWDPDTGAYADSQFPLPEGTGGEVDEDAVRKIVENYLAVNPPTVTESDPTVPAWAKEPTKPSYTASEVGADPSGTAASQVSAHNTGADTHSDIRLLIQGLTDRLNVLADSDDTTLDQLSEIVAYIKSNRDLIDAVTTSKVSVTDIVNDLVTNVANKPLSAAQGVALKELIDGISVPDKLPNPNALTFTGGATGSYDGSEAMTVEIPSGGGGGITGFRRVVDTTLTEAAEIVNLTTDINGNTFSLSECYLFIEAACTEPNTITYIPNGYWTAGTYMISGSKTATDYPYIYIAYGCGGPDHFFGFELRHRTGVSMPNYNSNKSANWRPITSYKLAGKFAEGARFIIFGRDA